MIYQFTAACLGLFWATTNLCAAPEFFVFDNGVGRGSWTPNQQATTVKELGYDGISYNYTNPEDLALWQKECKNQGLKIYGLYYIATLDQAQAYDARLPEAIRLLKGTNTVLWLTIKKSTREGDLDRDAVKLIQQLADVCQESGVRLALYGHVGFQIASAADSLRLTGMANRKNVGASINLCHEYLSGHGDQLDETLKLAAKQSTLVSINGIDVANKNYVMRLDQGDFDMVAYLQKLHAAGYRGPIGLQCYKVPGDQRENLAANIATWRRIAAQADEKIQPQGSHNSLTPEETAAGWKLLFDGKTTQGWRGFQKPAFPDHGWVLEDGCLKCLGLKGGDILTTSTFNDFEFSWEWRLSFRGNTGVKYFVDEKRPKQSGAIAHEYQAIDQANYIDEPLNEKKVTGAWYDVIAPLNAKSKPLGEFNQSRVVVRGNQVEHYLNGDRVVTYDTHSPEVATAITHSKFKDIPGYANKIPTPILLQDHNSVVWFRNLKLRELQKP